MLQMFLQFVSFFLDLFFQKDPERFERAVHSLVTTGKVTPQNLEICVIPDRFIGVTAAYCCSTETFFVSEGCMKLLSKLELEAVLAHELGHQFYRASHAGPARAAALGVGCPKEAMRIELQADAYAVAWGYKAPLYSSLCKVFSANMIQGDMPDDVFAEYKELVYASLVEPRLKALL